MLCSLPDVCNCAYKGNRPLHNTQKQGVSLLALTICHQIMGSLYPFQNWHMHSSSDVQFFKKGLKKLSHFLIG